MSEEELQRPQEDLSRSIPATNERRGAKKAADSRPLAQRLGVASMIEQESDPLKQHKPSFSRKRDSKFNGKFHTPLKPISFDPMEDAQSLKQQSSSSKAESRKLGSPDRESLPDAALPRRSGENFVQKCNKIKLL